MLLFSGEFEQTLKMHLSVYSFCSDIRIRQSTECNYRIEGVSQGSRSLMCCKCSLSFMPNIALYFLVCTIVYGEIVCCQFLLVVES